MYKETPFDEFITYLLPKLQHFVKHNFQGRWRNKHFKTCVKLFLENSIVYVVDFAENYTFQVQDEMQSMHWHSFQITLLVDITYCHNLNQDPHDEDSFILIDYRFYILDDRKHDYEFVQHCFKLHWCYLYDQGFQPTWMC